MYIYEGHMGGLYTSDKPLGYEDLYCDECGDSNMSEVSELTLDLINQGCALMAQSKYKMHS